MEPKEQQCDDKKAEEGHDELNEKGSPLKNGNGVASGHLNENEEDSGLCKVSPAHSWISNSSSCISFGEMHEEEDLEGGDGGEDDYEYCPYTHEYVPRIKEPPSEEDSDDGLLICKETRDASLSYVAQALLESARVNQEKWEEEQRRKLAGRKASIPALAKMLFVPGKARALCTIEEMPEHLRFNKYILSGYRALGDFWACVRSLGYLHNETLNIFTHIAPIIYIFLYWHTPSMFPWDDIAGNRFLNILGWAHIASALSPWIGSVIYHLFMSYAEGGERFYQLLLQIDMFGIWVTECFGALVNLTAAAWCLPKDWQTAIMTCYGLAAVWGLQKALTAWTPMARRMCFAPVFVFRIAAFFLRLSPWGGGNPEILWDVILQDVLSIAGGIIGVVRIPEKFFPGHLDIWFNSHHIMHLMVVWAVTHMNAATNGDMRWVIANYDQAHCPRLIN